MMTACEIKNNIPLEQVLSSIYGLEVKSRMPCPIHKGTDNNFSIKNDCYTCFSCGASGDIFNLVQELSNTDFVGAKSLICEGFNLTPTHRTKEEKEAYRAKLERLKKEQESKRILRKLRRYQHDRICQTLRSLRTEEGNSFSERHLEGLLSQFDKKPDFFIEHDVTAQLKTLLYRYGTNTEEQAELINIYKNHGAYTNMKIVIDTREQTPYSFAKQQYNGSTTTQGTLSTGDYSIKGLESFIAIERKSLDDLTGTLTSGRERFCRECQRGQGLDYFGLVIEASINDVKEHNYRSKMQPHALLQSIASFSVKYGLHVHFCGDRDGGEYMTFSLLEKFLANKQKQLESILQDTGV